jgi:hypothetical protein
MPTSLDGRKRALPVSDDPLARHHRSVAFDRLLESVHREHLSPFDLRVLLRVTDREATLGDLAESMGQPPSVLRRARARASSHAVCFGVAGAETATIAWRSRSRQPRPG